jgi:hypothetical protein
LGLEWPLPTSAQDIMSAAIWAGTAHTMMASVA